jgi:hypothetical protein
MLLAAAIRPPEVPSHSFQPLTLERNIRSTPGSEVLQAARGADLKQNHIKPSPAPLQPESLLQEEHPQQPRGIRGPNPTNICTAGWATRLWRCPPSCAHRITPAGQQPPPPPSTQSSAHKRVL